ncbi:MAG: hypothetical protein ABF293_01120 [Flavobacteriaceae bacterium]
MKKKIQYYWFVIAIFALTSCTSDDSNSDMTANLDAQIEEVQNLVSSGSWSVASFIDSGVDETDDFAGYTFAFNPDGSLLADNGSNQIEGSWSITGDDSDDSSSDDSMDDDSDDIDFNIFFASPDRFAELTEDWEIVSRTNSRIELIHISGGNGGTDTLILERN